MDGANGKFNFDGTLGNEVYARIHFNLTADQLTRIDEIIDDGNGSTSMARTNSDGLELFIGEGPSW